MNMRSIYSQVCLLHHCLRAVARRCVHSMAAFLAPFPSAPARSVGNATCNKWRMGDVAVVGTGYALLDALKGVVIGPTVNEIVAALAGGTVGVMGTIIALEVGRQRAKERKQCPYCRGTGKLPCGECYTLGSVPSSKAVGAQEGCVLCQERGFLMCNHVRDIANGCCRFNSEGERFRQMLTLFCFVSAICGACSARAREGLSRLSTSAQFARSTRIMFTTTQT